jgi:hypothetical protein
MTYLLAAVAALGWVAAGILGLCLSASARRRSVLSALRLRSSVEPYLLRRATEYRLAGSPSSPTDPPEEVVAALCDLAGRLTEHERSNPALGDTMRIAISETQPAQKSEGGV